MRLPRARDIDYLPLGVSRHDFSPRSSTSMAPRCGTVRHRPLAGARRAGSRSRTSLIRRRAPLAHEAASAARLRGPCPGRATAEAGAPSRASGQRWPAQGACAGCFARSRVIRFLRSSVRAVARVHDLALLCQMSTRDGARSASTSCPPARIGRVTRRCAGDESRRRGFRRGSIDVDFRQLGKHLIDALRGLSSIGIHFVCTAPNPRSAPARLGGDAIALTAGA